MTDFLIIAILLIYGVSGYFLMSLNDKFIKKVRKDRSSLADERLKKKRTKNK